MKFKIDNKTYSSIAASVAAFFVIWFLGAVTEYTHINLMIASFGPTCAIVFALPNSPAARARNIIFAYTTTSVISYLLYHSIGYYTEVMALGVAISIFLMMYENLIHPPAAGIPIFFYYIKPEPEFLFFPILTGCIIIILARKVYKLLRKAK